MLKELRKQLAEIMKRLDEFKAITTRELTEEELTEKRSLLDEGEIVQAKIVDAEKEERVRKFANSSVEEPPVETATDDPGKEQGFRGLGEMLQAVAMAAKSNYRTVDERLIESRAVSGYNEGVPSEGGFLVQTDYLSEISKIAHNTGILASRCRNIPVGANANGIKYNAVDETSRATGSRWGGVRGYWVGEADTVTASKIKLRKQSLDLEKLMALYYATDEILQDASALGSLASQAVGEELGFLLDDAIIRGSGAGQPLGILNAGCLVSQAKESGQSEDTIVAENVIKMYSRMHPASLPRATWYINMECMPQIQTMYVPVGTGGQLVYMPPNGLASAPFGTLLGRPIQPIEQAAALGDVGDIVFADFGQYNIITKGGVNAAESMHVRFLNDEMVFRFTYRVNGMPEWKAALTPYKGAATLSPFVALAERA